MCQLNFAKMNTHIELHQWYKGKIYVRCLLWNDSVIKAAI